jgi:hypothetical protein
MKSGKNENNKIQYLRRIQIALTTISISNPIGIFDIAFLVTIAAIILTLWGSIGMPVADTIAYQLWFWHYTVWVCIEKFCTVLSILVACLSFHV